MKRLLAGGSYPLTALLAVAVLAQAGFWYVATPGPALAGAERSFSAAVQAVAWSFALLGVVPYIAARLAGFSFSNLGLALGNWRAGAVTVVVVAVVVAPFLFFGATGTDLQNTYPWPGSWLRGPTRFAAWAGIYVVYYAAFEFFYRGFLLQVASRAFGGSAGLWFQAFAATLIHAGKPLPEFVLALPASLLFALFALRTRSLIWPILLHLAIGLCTDAAVLWHTGGW